MAKGLYGYTGRLLKVDLTSGKIDTFGTEPYIDKFLGGRGMMAKIHWDMVTHKPKRIGAYDPQNPFVIMTGPLTATVAPSSGRTECSAISPMTYPDECYTESSFGLHFGPELKFAGYDGMVVIGKADRPVWIFIDDRTVQIRDGRHLWGLDMFDTQERIWRDLGDEYRKTQILVTGPAGENLVRSASIMHGSSAGAGQGGFGAVWGSKNLKAIAVRGTGSVKVGNPERLMKISKESHRLIYRPDQRPETWKNLAAFHRVGWSFYQGAGVSGWEWLKKKTSKAEACFGCPLGCHIFVEIPDRKGRYTAGKCNQMSWYLRNVMTRYGEPTDVYWQATQIGDALGMNAFEMIGLLPWLTGCIKEGLLTEKDVGLKMADIGTLEFADQLCNMIAYRKGFGKILAEGAPRAADITGKGHHLLPHFNRGFAHHWSPRAWSPIALFWATDSRHPQTPIHQLYWTFRMNVKGTWPQAGFASEKEVAQWSKELFGTTKAIDYSDENFYDPIHAETTKWAQDGDVGLKRSTILCDYGPFPIYSSYFANKEKSYRPDTPSPELEVLMVNAAVGRELIPNGQEGMKMGERFWNLERAIMAREGRTRKDDTLVKYLFEKEASATVTGPEGKTIKVNRKLDHDKFEKLKDAYYVARGWDVATGIPTRKKLEQLDLKDVADQLDKGGLLPKAAV